jgi:predicted MFS family arabinose efflux permease
MNRKYFPINPRVIAGLLLGVVLISAAAIVTDIVSPRNRAAATTPLFPAPATATSPAPARPQS